MNLTKPHVINDFIALEQFSVICPEFFVFSHLNSMERLDHLAEKFKHKCNIHEAWTSGKVDTLKTDDQEKATLADVLVDNQS